jgi:hypothetical protein
MSNKLVCGVGIYNKGKYPGSENGKKTKAYATWADMLRRCYDLKYKEKVPTYIECSVHEEWIYFQKFAEWYFANYYEIPLLGITQLDKDILTKGNKIYSPEMSVLVPRTINNLFTKSNAKRGKYPIGVYYHKTAKKYRAMINYGDGRSHHLGSFDTPKEAFNAYRIAKEAFIKKTAETYKSMIPSKLYEAMLRYEVSIDD